MRVNDTFLEQTPAFSIARLRCSFKVTYRDDSPLVPLPRYHCIGVIWSGMKSRMANTYHDMMHDRVCDWYKSRRLATGALDHL